MGKVHYTLVMTYYRMLRKLRAAGMEPTPQTIRTTADRFAALLPMPFNTELQVEKINGVECGRVSYRHAHREGVFVFIHGGGFAFGSVKTHKVPVAHFCKMTGMTGYIPEYRLSPESTYPIPLDDCHKAWLGICNRHPDQSIYLLGDSAGGNLAAALVLRLREAGQRLPDKLVLMSPWLDLSPQSESIVKNRYQDSLFDADDLLHYAANYTGAANPDDADVSPIRGDLKGFPPTLVQVAENELLFYDSERFAEAMKEAGSPVLFRAWPELFHSWQLFPDFVPEAKTALQEAADFLACDDLSESKWAIQVNRETT